MSSPTARDYFRGTLLAHKSLFVQAAGAALLANLLVLSTSLYSMQVYDRVIPSQGVSTLIVLTIGVLIALVLEFIIKLARSHLLEVSIQGMDRTLSHTIFQRVLGIRLDQFPPSVGTLSAQLKSYETIRAFLSSATLYLLVDAPFAILFLGAIALIAGFSVALIPAGFFVLAMLVGLFHKGRVARHAQKGFAATNHKLGLLVETVESAESIKACGGNARQTARWDELTQQSMESDLAIRRVSESAGYWAAFIQQVSYVLLVAMGAWIAATSTELTIGSIIACSILSGRVLAPVAVLPGLMVQAAHARAALDALEKVFALKRDNHGVDTPLTPETIRGEWRLAEAKFAYAGGSQFIQPMAMPKLHIRAGEKLAILGPIGSGKSTLLKLLAGLYAPMSGQILLDGLDIQQIGRNTLSRQLGYLPQDVKLLAGTLRTNLTVGLSPLPAEATLIEACRRTGLDQFIASHPQGLDLPIGEGGQGVSGGQRQLIALTRLILSQPQAWLLDEPTAAMDEASEARAIYVLKQHIAPQSTLILITHKPALLTLVDRLVVLLPQGGAMDGPRDAVLAQLRQNSVRVVKPEEAYVA